LHSKGRDQQDEKLQKWEKIWAHHLADTWQDPKYVRTSCNSIAKKQKNLKQAASKDLHIVD
jgi:hypothetical protein